jgi:cold shock CspA family protein
MMIMKNEAQTQSATATPVPTQKFVGHIRSWDEKLRWGWISGEDGKDIFFHWTSLANPAQRVARYMKVEYLAQTFKGKPCAREVVVLA